MRPSQGQQHSLVQHEADEEQAALAVAAVSVIKVAPY
jgi:hypothetical protein